MTLYEMMKQEAERAYGLGDFGQFAHRVRVLWFGWPVLRGATWAWAAPRLF